MMGDYRTSAARSVIVLLDMYTSWVMLTLAWPSWFATSRPETPASSSRVATVLRKVCEDAHGNVQQNIEVGRIIGLHE